MNSEIDAPEAEVVELHEDLTTLSKAIADLEAAMEEASELCTAEKKRTRRRSRMRRRRRPLWRRRSRS